MKIRSEFIERKLNQLQLSPEQFGKKLGMTGEGFRKILKTGSTKEATVRMIAEHLGLHWSEISGDAPLPLTFRESNIDRQVELLKDDIMRHEKQISELKDLMLDLYRQLGKAPL